MVKLFQVTQLLLERKGAEAASLRQQLKDKKPAAQSFGPSLCLPTARSLRLLHPRPRTSLSTPSATS